MFWMLGLGRGRGGQGSLGVGVKYGSRTEFFSCAHSMSFFFFFSVGYISFAQVEFFSSASLRFLSFPFPSAPL